LPVNALAFFFHLSEESGLEGRVDGAQ
jgi:hypothetical protein